MNCLIERATFSGEIPAIPSKSYAHRIAICNFLAGKNPDSGCGDFTSKDISATEECLNRIMNKERVLDCGESGSTLRFLLPLCGALGGEFEFIGHGKLLDRPNDELFAVMNENGVKTEKKETIKISGKLKSGKYKIRGDISSQYISGLIMALPILDGESEIILTTPLASAPYVKITIEVLKSFNVNILETENGYKIAGNQKYFGNINPEGDWSNSAFFLVAGAINGSVTLTGLNPDSVQGDRAIIDILRMAGAEITEKNDSVTVKKRQLKAFTFDANDCPDLVPIASVLGAVSNEKCVITNIERLKIKESDRVESTINMLASFSIKAESDGKNLFVYGGKVKGGKINSYNDHRIAMSSAVLASVAEGNTVIFDAQAVNKSYPTFFKDYAKVGGKVNEQF